MTPDLPTANSELTDATVLRALDRACEQESGGWASAMFTGQQVGMEPYLFGTRLSRLAREGTVERWVPRAGGDPISLYRRRHG